jgi:hypothetical protein
VLKISIIGPVYYPPATIHPETICNTVNLFSCISMSFSATHTFKSLLSRILSDIRALTKLGRTEKACHDV